MKSEEVITIPKGEALRAENHRFFVWAKAISELIDNSFDAFANTIIIKRPNKNQMILEIIDDGIGCGKLEDMVRMGARQLHGSKGIGRYGVGLKDVAIALWGEMQIRSFYHNEMRILTIIWDDIFDHNFPKLKADVYSKKEAMEYFESKGEIFRQGTKIIFSSIGKSKLIDVAPRQIATLFREEILNELRFRYTPALNNGKTIEFINVNQPIKLTPWTEPKFIERFRFDDQEIEGKSFSINGGIVAEGEINEKPGFHICHPQRVIETSTDPCGEFGVSRIFAWIFLSNDWVLERNKEKVIDKDRESLMNKIFSLCELYIRKGSFQPITLNLDGLANELSKELTDVLKKAKEQRKEGDKEITIQPQNSERKRIRIVNFQKGENPFKKARVDQIKIEFGMLGDKKICEIHHGDKIDRIELNKMNPKIAQYIKDENKDALCMMAICFYSAKTAMTKRGQLWMHFKNIKLDEGMDWDYMQQGVLTYTNTVQLK